MHLTRRAAFAASLAAIVPALPVAANDAALRILIRDVIDRGDVSQIADIVTPEIAMPDFNIAGIDDFTRASIAAHKQRQRRYSAYTFAIEAVAAVAGWHLAYVRFSGTTTVGGAEDVPVFYAARMDGGRIAELFM